MAWFSKKDKSGDISPTTAVPNGENAGLRYFVANLQGIGSRAMQEDSFTLANVLDEKVYSQSGLLLCVCDGMGGMKGGKLASKTAVDSIRGTFQSLDPTRDIIPQLTEGIYETSDKILSLLGGDGGSTAVVCVLLHEQLHYVSVGDSFLYLMRGGKLIRINSEHNQLHGNYSECLLSGGFDPQQCRSDPEGHALTSFLGMNDTLLIDFNASPIPLKQGDVLLVCSDGVAGVLEEEEILAALSIGSVNQICVELERAIKAHAVPHQDNYTALVAACI